MRIIPRMRTAPATLVGILLITGLLAGALLPLPGRAAIAATRCTLDRAISTSIDPRPFLTSGYNVRWNAPTNRLAYMQTDGSGYYRVFTMRPDGTDRRTLGDGRLQLPPQASGRRLLASVWSLPPAGGREAGMGGSAAVRYSGPVNRYPGQLFLGTDWYAMRASGEDGKRLTTMNVNRTDNPQAISCWAMCRRASSGRQVS